MMKKKFVLALMLGMMTISFTGCNFAQKIWNGAMYIGEEYAEAMEAVFGQNAGAEDEKDGVYIEVLAENPDESFGGDEADSEVGDIIIESDYDESEEKTSAEVTDISYYSEGFAEMERISKSVIGKVMEMDDWQNHLTEEEADAMDYYYVDENGSGYMILSCFDGASLSNYSNVFSTTNGGQTWTNQNENGFDFDEIYGVFSLNDHLIVYSRYGNSRAGYYNMFSVSHDRGCSFENVNPYMVADLGNKVIDMQIIPELLDMDPEFETMTIGWSSYEEGNDDYFLVCEYDMNLNRIFEISRNKYFYNIYEWQEYHEFVFDDSDRRFLSKEDMDMLEEAANLYSECDYGRTDFEEILSYAINEIYFRKGYSFKDTPYEEYYSDYSWYYYGSPYYKRPESAQKNFNQFEQANVDLLAEYRAQAAIQ